MLHVGKANYKPFYMVIYVMVKLGRHVVSESRTRIICISYRIDSGDSIADPAKHRPSLKDLD